MPRPSDARPTRPSPAAPPDDPVVTDQASGEDIDPEDLPELDAASEDDAVEADREAHARQDIVGDVDGDDYRAGTISPDGSDRGPWRELSEENFDGDEGRDQRPHGGLVR